MIGAVVLPCCLPGVRAGIEGPDLWLFTLLNHSYRSLFLDEFSRALSESMFYVITFSTVALVGFGILTRRHEVIKVFLLLSAALILQFGTSQSLKHLVHRSRPYQLRDAVVVGMRANDESFPSGHASASFAFATVLAQGYRPVAIPLFVYATLVSLSRVYGGHHFPLDVLAGAVLGFGFGRLAWAFHGKTLRLLNREGG